MSVSKLEIVHLCRKETDFRMILIIIIKIYLTIAPRSCLMCLAGSESLFPLLYHLTLESCLVASSHSCMTRKASERCLHRNWQSPLGPGDLILSWDWREWIVVYCTSCSWTHCTRPSENQFQTPWEILLLHLPPSISFPWKQTSCMWHAVTKCMSKE